ncbi:sortilin-like [Actinia tenebrosa]|uniref:Sortilin-like n=1 Tax=Actinia tenebrosa TaxID=6105 RepID=A0A6P8J204_ACTTE|nr:sortilin-like [Actinia tenebrosa]
MASNIVKLCIFVLQLSIVVQGVKYPAKSRVKDIFEAPKSGYKELFSTHQHEENRLRRSQQEVLTNKHRIRRNTNPDWCSDPTKIKDHDIINRLWKFPVGDNHLSFSMTWVGKDFQTILLLATTEFFIFSVQRSALYKSTDFGETFNKTNQNIYEGNIRKNDGLQRSPVDPNMVILVSFSLPIIGVSSLYITLDGTKTWKKVDLGFQVRGALEFHPRNKNWILATANGLKGAYLSKDSGMTWKLLRPHVISVKWGARQDKMVSKEEQTILMNVVPNYNGRLNIYNQELWRSRDLGEHFELIAKHIYSFGVQGPFLFVSVDYKKDEKTRIMQVSKDGGDTFENAQVPKIKPEQFYSILDMSEGMVFLHVDDIGDSGKGVLYTSDADGIVFDKSLENHVYTNTDGITDFYKVESMNGTYISSRMNQDNSLSSLISFDRGGEWNPIKLDDKLCKGQTATKDANVCSLQIHNAFSRSRGVNVSRGPLSEASAVGIIIAHANPGYALNKKSIGIWMSRDGGYTWKDTGLRGAHHYAIADHGSLIVAIPVGSEEVRTLWYSVDEGGCWFSYEFPKEKFHLTGLVTSPGAQTMRVSLWGYAGGTRRWMVNTLNFRRVLEKKCMYNKVPDKSDYEEWIPHGNGKNKGCLLGKKITFLRPKPKVLCFNGEDYIPKATIERCPCSMDDLECDYGYYRKVGETKCKLDKTKKPKFCKNGEEIDVESKGYRLIPGDECSSPGTNVEKYVDAHKKCQDQYANYGALTTNEKKSKSSKSLVVAAVVVPITIVALVIAIYFGKKYLDIRKSKPSYQYSSVSQEPEQDMFSSPSHGLDDDDTAMIEV